MDIFCTLYCTLFCTLYNYIFVSLRLLRAATSLFLFSVLVLKLRNALGNKKTVKLVFIIKAGIHNPFLYLRSS